MHYLPRIGSILSAATGFLCLSFSYYQPANASIYCVSNIAINHSNGSLFSCILDANTTVRFSNHTFPCKKRQNIAFDTEGKLMTCVLSRKIRIRQNNSINECPVNARININYQGDTLKQVNCGEVVVTYDTEK